MQHAAPLQQVPVQAQCGAQQNAVWLLHPEPEHLGGNAHNLHSGLSRGLRKNGAAGYPAGVPAPHHNKQNSKPLLAMPAGRGQRAHRFAKGASCIGRGKGADRSSLHFGNHTVRQAAQQTAFQRVGLA
jgi:hypothetical protein